MYIFIKFLKKNEGNRSTVKMINTFHSAQDVGILLFYRDIFEFDYILKNILYKFH